MVSLESMHIAWPFAKESVGGGTFGLHADDFYLGAELLGGEGDAADQGAVADGNENDVGACERIQNFASNGCGAGQHLGVDAVYDVVPAGFLGELRGVLPGLLQKLANFHYFRAEVGDAGFLRGIRVFGKIDPRGKVLAGRGVGNGGAVIARTAGDNTGKFAVPLLPTSGDGVIGATDLERTRRTFTFEFEIDPAIPLRRQLVGFQETTFGHKLTQQRLCGAHALHCQRRRRSGCGHHIPPPMT